MEILSLIHTLSEETDAYQFQPFIANENIFGFLSHFQMKIYLPNPLP